jgi:TatD DNase family protein
VFDSHCHPTDIADGLECVRRARDEGVQSVLCCGYHGESNRAVLALRRAEPTLPIALGLHPWFATEGIAPVLASIESEHPAAIGECGLDGHPDPTIPSLTSQLAALEPQLDAAGRLGLPVTVHSRRGVERFRELLVGFPRVRGALHAFSGSPEQARFFVERGWLIGIGGAVTRPGAHRIRRMAERLPLSAIVLETDAPAIGLLGVLPGSVRPAHLPMVAAALASLRHMDVAELVSLTDSNAATLFGTSAVFRR